MIPLGVLSSEYVEKFNVDEGGINMALTIVKRCNRCRQPMRNDGTDENPKWVCNNPNCIKYVPPAESNTKKKK